MDAIEAILGRRSIRVYTDEPVDDATVETLLRAAMAAPSAGNQQPWHFVVVRSAEAREAVAAASPYAGMLVAASVGIVVCGDTSDEKYPDYWVQDCSAAIANLLIAAHAIGLGAVWLGCHPREERVARVKQALGLPAHIRPLGVISVGHPAEKKPPAERYDPERVHIERW